MGEIPEDIARAAVNAIDEMDQPTGLSRVEIVENYILDERNRSAWQPIETAPKDGRMLYLMWEPSDPTTGQGFWRADKWVAVGVFYKHNGPRTAPYELRECFPSPTHWAPLPHPPTPSTEKERAAS